MDIGNFTPWVKMPIRATFSFASELFKLTNRQGCAKKRKKKKRKKEKKKPIRQSLVFAKSRYTRVHNPSRSLKVAMLGPFRQLTTRHSKCSGYTTLRMDIWYFLLFF